MSGCENVVKGLHGGFYLGGVDADSDEACHVRYGEFVPWIKGHGAEFRGDVAEVREVLRVEGEQLTVFDEGLDGVFAGLNEIVFSTSSEELAEHLFVGGVVFYGDLDASFLGEVVDDALRNIFGPAEEAKFLFFGGGGGSGGRSDWT